MLAEKLTQIGCRIVQANTDGLFVLLKKSIYEQANKICREWEQLTRLTLEEERFEAMYQYAINDYIAVKEGYKETKNPDLIKTKGMFITKVLLGKGLSAKIIPEAIIKYFVDKVPVEDTINGGYLWKWKDTGHKEGEIITYIEPYVGERKYKASARQYQNMLTASGVTLLNKFDDKPIEERKINYRYYLREALKIIEELQPRQLELF